MSGFVEEKSFSTGDTIVKLWLHKASGCRLRLVQTEGPMATTCEWTHADDGLPHTLEHLVFLGSADYPFKGILDKLANRCLARGTNAWTDVDHTAYTVTTAGSKGLLALLPIYVDHILRPTITDAGFATEVHHVDGEGEDKGVVYCEMQGRENTAESVAERACLDELYPGSGYSAETGGICSNLRTLTADQVRRYHADFYTPENMCVVVTGGVDEADLLRVAGEALDRSAAAKSSAATTGGEKTRPNGGGGGGTSEEKNPRPWSSAVPAQRAAEEDRFDGNGARVRMRHVEFPAAESTADDATGLVCLAWRGNAYGAWAKDAKDAALWLYLCDGAASPFARRFVDGGECSGVWPTSERFRVGYRQLWFEDVAVDRLEVIDGLFAELIRDEIAKGVDVAKMRDIIERAKRKTVASLEDDPARVTPMIKHFVYAADNTDASDLEAMSGTLALLDVALTVEKADWDAMLRDLATRRRVCVVSRPSQLRADAERDDEKRRIRESRAKVGDEGLADLKNRLAAAIAENETAAPEEVLAGAVSKPDVREAISRMFRVQSLEQQEEGGVMMMKGGKKAPVRRGAYQRPGAEDEATLAALEASVGALDWASSSEARWCVEAVAGTHFARVDVAADTSALPWQLREYVPLLAEAIFKSAVTADDGTVVGYEENIADLRRQTVTYGAGLSEPHFSLSAKLDGASVRAGVDLMRRAMYQARLDLDPDRLQAAVSKLALQLSAELREGASVAQMALRCLAFDAEASNYALLAAVAQRDFLARAKFALSPLGKWSGARRTFLRGLRDCRNQLFAPPNLRARVAGDLLKTRPVDAGLLAALTRVVVVPPTDGGGGAATAATDASVGPPILSPRRPPAPPPRKYGRCAIVGLGALEGGSAFLARCAPGPSKDASLADHAALAVAIEYLTALEGDFWVKIRGAGLAYGASIRLDPPNELVSFSLYRASDPFKALTAAKTIVRDYANDMVPFRDLDFENARGSLASGYIEAEKTRSAALSASWRRALRGHKADRHLRFLDATASVTVDDAKRAIKAFLVPLFDDAASLTALAVAPAKLADLAATLCDPATTEIRTYTDATMADLVKINRGPTPQRRLAHKVMIIAAAAAVAVIVARRR